MRTCCLVKNFKNGSRMGENGLRRGWYGVFVLEPSPPTCPYCHLALSHGFQATLQNCAPSGTKIPRTSGWGGCPTGIVGGAGASSGCLRKRCSAVRVTLVLTRFRGIRDVHPGLRCGRIVAAQPAAAGHAVAAAHVGRHRDWLRPAVGGLRCLGSAGACLWLAVAALGVPRRPAAGCGRPWPGYGCLGRAAAGLWLAMACCSQP